MPDFRRELVFNGACNTTAKPVFHDVHHQVGDRVYAAYAEDIIALGDQVTCFQVHLRVALAETIEEVPVSGGGAAVEQTGLSEQVAAGTHAADTGATVCVVPQYWQQRRGGAQGGQGIAPDGGQYQQVQRGQCIDGDVRKQPHAAGQPQGPPVRSCQQGAHLRLPATPGAGQLAGCLQDLHGQGDAGGEDIGEQ